MTLILDGLKTKKRELGRDRAGFVLSRNEGEKRGREESWQEGRKRTVEGLKGKGEDTNTTAENGPLMD